MSESLGAIVFDAMNAYERLKAGGLSREDALRSLDAIVRDVWPKPHGRTEPWKFYCEDCSDSGWEHRICTPKTHCGRPFRFPKQASHDFTGQGHCTPGHTYVRPCWCAKGLAKKAQLEGRSMADEDFTTAGKSKPMTRVGR